MIHSGDSAHTGELLWILFGFLSWEHWTQTLEEPSKHTTVVEPE